MSVVSKTVTCRRCGKEITISATQEQWDLYVSGDLSIQQTFPTHTPAERELLVSAVCGTCFDELFKE